MQKNRLFCESTSSRVVDEIVCTSIYEIQSFLTSFQRQMDNILPSLQFGGDGIASRMRWKLDVYLEFHIFVREQRKNYVRSSKLQEKRGNWLHAEASTKGQAESVYNNAGKRLSALTISNQRPAGGEKLERKKEI